jgi:hypothetical protein
MNCDACNQEFDLIDRIPYAIHICLESFCYDCIKGNSQNEMAKCPSCKEETNIKISQLKPNQKIMKLMEKLIIDQK